MLLKRSTLVLLVLALVATSVAAQSLGDIIPITEPKAAAPAAEPAAEPGAVSPKPNGPDNPVTPTDVVPTPSTSAPATSPPAPTSQPVEPTVPPVIPPSSSAEPVVPPPASSSASSSHVVQPTQNPRPTTNRQSGTGTVVVPTGSGTATVTSSTPTPTNSDNKKSTGGNLATAGIVVGSVVVAAAIGIWVFRKWKLSPSRDFQRKIGGDDYQDYPRTYESDTVFLRNLGDQPAEPAPTKSPYNASASLPSDDQYYDTGYANDTTAPGGAYAHGGHDGYGQPQAAYDHQGYDHAHGYDGYDNTTYGAAQHDGYGGSQVGGGGYGGSQVGGGYGGSQVGGYNAQDAGYAQSNVGGGYQHQGYEDYGHGRR
ncbi:hypothetical protein BGZ96_009549 [Linnemannia gamsii]|uniref:Uncharacterized protein n=1 Tax=Linnemannia gamsii TaxID=64522 RepID=A0ABQ7JXY1_9FUNG|nr:hypothetical protein BGZ96_009549 [Linnemannia gamsii]